MEFWLSFPSFCPYGLVFAFLVWRHHAHHAKCRGDLRLLLPDDALPGFSRLMFSKGCYCFQGTDNVLRQLMLIGRSCQWTLVRQIEWYDQALLGVLGIVQLAVVSCCGTTEMVWLGKVVFSWMKTTCRCPCMSGGNSCALWEGYEPFCI